MVQLNQYWYQSRVLYRKMALGESQSMAVLTELPEKNSLAVVVLSLLVVYLWQLYNAYTMVDLYMDPDASVEVHELQVPIAGVLFLVLGVGNMLTTLRVLVQKVQSSRRLATLKKHFRAAD